MATINPSSPTGRIVPVTLTPEQERWMDHKLRQQPGKQPAEIIGEALTLQQHLEELEDPKALDELRRQIQIGTEQLRRGEYADYDAESVIAKARGR